MERDPGGPDAAGGPDNSTDGAADRDRERTRVEFYATYDVMTGVRIAATLGGFFALMVFLIVYKSRSKSVKALNDPKIVEFAEAVVAEERAVEEERRLTAAMEDALSERARTRPAPRATRHAPHAPPAPRHDRRFSSATWSSSGSEYLERRGSSVVCALERRRRAPLASVGADSVFAEKDSTDDEVDQFSTDSGGGGGDCTELASRLPPIRIERSAGARETLF